MATSALTILTMIAIPRREELIVEASVKSAVAVLPVSSAPKAMIALMFPTMTAIPTKVVLTVSDTARNVMQPATFVVGSLEFRVQMAMSALMILTMIAIQRREELIAEASVKSAVAELPVSSVPKAMIA